MSAAAATAAAPYLEFQGQRDTLTAAVATAKLDSISHTPLPLSISLILQFRKSPKFGSRTHGRRLVALSDDRLFFLQSRSQSLFWGKGFDCYTQWCKTIPSCLNFRGLVRASVINQPQPAKSAIFAKIGQKTNNLAGLFLHIGVLCVEELFGKRLHAGAEGKFCNTTAAASPFQAGRTYNKCSTKRCGKPEDAPCSY